MADWRRVYAKRGVTVLHGDCRAILAKARPESIDAVITDPPYGIGFMGKAWDGTAIREAAAKDRENRKSLGPESSSRPGRTQARSSSAFGNEAIIAGPVRGGEDFQKWCEAWALDCFRALKPGGYMLVFGGSRTWHRLAAGIEDAGFEMRDSIAWLYGSGFPKSLDVSKAIDKAAGATREVVGRGENWGASTAAEGRHALGDYSGAWDITQPATDAAKQWAGWGTALKPAFEPIIVARKPLAEKTVAANVLAHGTGAINIDATRVAAETGRPHIQNAGGKSLDACYGSGKNGSRSLGVTMQGRWPTNVVLDADAAAEIDRQSGVTKSGTTSIDPHYATGGIWANGNGIPQGPQYGDTGGASRFFPVFPAKYQAKAPSKERPKVDGVAHPTVKPLELMRWLVRLVTPPGGVILDPFAGTGTTAQAARLEGFKCVLIEQENSYIPLIVERLNRS